MHVCVSVLSVWAKCVCLDVLRLARAMGQGNRLGQRLGLGSEKYLIKSHPVTQPNLQSRRKRSMNIHGRAWEQGKRR